MDNRIVFCLARILTLYDDYGELKNLYAEEKVARDDVIDAFSDICKSVYDLVKVMYSMTDMPLERIQVQNMIEALKADICY